MSYATNANQRRHLALSVTESSGGGSIDVNSETLNFAAALYSALGLTRLNASANIEEQQ
jgi:hypothetical protein